MHPTNWMYFISIHQGSEVIWELGEEEVSSNTISLSVKCLNFSQ